MSEPEKSVYGKGHVADESDPRDWTAGALLGAPASLPAESLGLVSLVRRVRNQLRTSACVGCATASAVDVRLRRMGVVAPEPSALALYALARGYDAGPDDELRDEGCVPRNMMKAARDSGVPPEDLWPFDPDQVDSKVPWDVHQKASAFKLRAWRRIDTQGQGRLDEIARAVSAGYPVPYGRLVGRAFEAYQGKGAVEETLPQDSLGGHMTTILGYTTDGGERIWRCLNSWGSWGDGGFYWARSSSIVSAYASDFYVVEVDGPDVGED